MCILSLKMADEYCQTLSLGAAGRIRVSQFFLFEVVSVFLSLSFSREGEICRWFVRCLILGKNQLGRFACLPNHATDSISTFDNQRGMKSKNSHKKDEKFLFAKSALFFGNDNSIFSRNLSQFWHWNFVSRLWGSQLTILIKGLLLNVEYDLVRHSPRYLTTHVK